MLEQVWAALDDITGQYRDTRVTHCQVQVVSLEDRRCTLGGTVLDPETRTTLTRALKERFPEIAFDALGVRVLRPGKPLAVGTNITSLHAEPSFRSEMVSQLLIGWVVELLLEREQWAYVRQVDGYLGWAYRPYLNGTPAPDPTHIVCAPISLLRDAPDADAPLVSRLASGTAVHVTGAASPSKAASQPSWARLALAGGVGGWVPVVDLRALEALPQNAATRRQRMVEDAAGLTGVPYLWGGCTALGIDCSGMALLLHRLAGVTIPRDADMQFDAGQPVDARFEPGDLLFFGGQGEKRSITHVGMSLGGWRIVHSSRARNGVYEDDVRAVEHLRESFVGARTFLRN